MHAHEAAHGFDAAAMAAMYKRLPMAEKNLLKIFASNKYISLQVVNNRTGHIFLLSLIHI